MKDLRKLISIWILRIAVVVWPNDDSRQRLLRALEMFFYEELTPEQRKLAEEGYKRDQQRRPTPPK